MGHLREILFVVLVGVVPTIAYAQTISEFPLPPGAIAPAVITPGPDDALWFGAFTKIGRIDVGGSITIFDLPNPTTVGGITAGPDGNVWFTEPFASVIGRMTTAGSVTEFPIDQAFPTAITVGPDGRLWFADENHRIGAITTDGVVTFYDLPPEQSPWAITAGPDGNLWFTDGFYGIVSRITTSGTATHFTTRRFTTGIVAGPNQTLWMADMAEPLFGVDRILRIGTELTVREHALPPFFGTGTRGTNGIAFGPDDAVWFTEIYANSIGRMAASGEYSTFPIPTTDAYPWSIAVGSDGALWFTEQHQNKIGRITVPAFTAEPPTLQSSDTSSILEPGEACTYAPAWRNNGADPADLTAEAVSFVGPGTSLYLIEDGHADYGTIDPDSTADCLSTADCFSLSVWEAPRPLVHWDAYFTEDLSAGRAKTWTLHLGDSFTDVPRSSPFYPSIEAALHNGITSGCGDSVYCPGSPVTRAQMTVFLLRGRHGPDFGPFPPSGVVFADVPQGSFAAAWIEQAAAEGITAGCGGGNFCPDQLVTRAQMAVFLLRAQHLGGYAPPPATGVFADVPPGSFAADWIEQLAAEGISAGCGGGNFCPDAFVTREQMAALLGLTFGLSLHSSR